MATTIQISEDLKGELSSRKIRRSETYEDVIWAILQDIKDLDDDISTEIEIARGEIRSGEYYSLGDARKEIGI